MPASPALPHLPAAHALQALAVSADNAVLISVLVAAPLILVILWLADAIRPGSFSRQPGGSRDPQPVPAPVWLIAAIVTLLVGSTMQDLAGRTPTLAGHEAGSIRAMAAAALTSGIASLATGGTLIYLLLRAAPGAGLRPRWLDLPVGLSIFVICTPILLATMIAAPFFYSLLTGHDIARSAVGHETLSEILEARSDPWLIPLFVGLTVAAPIAEEIVFRLFLQTSILRLVRSSWIAVVCTSTLFAAAHWTTTNGLPPLAVLPIQFVLGLCLGLAYERTKRPLVPIVMHGAFNASQITLALLTR
ncbi:MAG: CPBP family intramembrane metalloprotease [Phycisphaerales bacterium]|nr:CPBP family intramembrane metalloprotease [Phycisphaerales bacterium]